MKVSFNKFFCLLVLVAAVATGLQAVDAASACGKSSPDAEAMKLAPCTMAAQDERASVSSSCCAQVKQIGQNPSCLCAILLSDTAKASGIKPEIAITIPKRCNIANRPVGYKCGREYINKSFLIFSYVCILYPFLVCLAYRRLSVLQLTPCPR